VSSFRFKRPSTALVVAVVALFLALGGTAGAVVTAAVPLAKRALVADKAKTATTAKVANVAKVANTAKKANTATTAGTAQNAGTLEGSTSAQIIAAATTAGANTALATSPAGPRPASTAAGLVTVRAGGLALNAFERAAFTVSCNPGEKALGGGYSTFDPVIALGSFPTSNGSAWTVDLAEFGDPATDTTGNVWVTCLK
jgi:hypothetical protein